MKPEEKTKGRLVFKAGKLVEERVEPLKWEEIPYRNKRAINGAARVTVFGLAKRRMRIMVAAEAAKKLGLQVGARTRLMRSGICLAFVPASRGLKVANVRGGEPGRVQILAAVPDGWPEDPICYDLATSGDDFYLEPVK